MEIILTVLLFGFLLFLLFLVWKHLGFPFCPDEIIGFHMQSALIAVTVFLAVIPTFLLMGILSEILKPRLDFSEEHVIRIALTLCVFVLSYLTVGLTVDKVLAKLNPEFDNWLAERKTKN